MPTNTFFFSLLVVALTGCGQTVLTKAPPPVEDPSMLGSTCEALFDAYASWATGCLGPTLLPGQRTELITRCRARAEARGVTAPPAAFHDCAVKIATSYCASLPLECMVPVIGGAPPIWVGGSVSPYYYEVFPREPGSLASGEVCSLDAQCQSNACLIQDTCGTCVDPKSLGEACSATSSCMKSECKKGLCVETGGAEGSACKIFTPVPGGLSDFYCSQSVCVPRPKLGEKCTIDLVPVCPEGADCIESVCQSFSAVNEGEVCDNVFKRCLTEGLHCAAGVCRKPLDNVPVGGDCSIDTCAIGLHCAGLTCVVPGNAGAPCVELASCVDGLTCLFTPGEGGQCGAPLGKGATCEGTDTCKSGLFCQYSKAEGSTCQPVPPPPGCTDSQSCSGDQICRWGVCGPFDTCSAP